ncbi:MAG: hypothetical protein ACXVCP_12870 [Bdellovibrio sp.]
MIKKLLLLSMIVLSGVTSSADNLQASNCQMYIRRLQALPSSHGSANMNVFVKVNWLGNGEYIQNVGFYGYNSDTTYSDNPSCNWNDRQQGTWYTQQPVSSPGYSYSTEYGEYLFIFRIRSGSVGGPCPGYSYSTIGTFFVQTNKNTYWLNPDLNSDQKFYFDENGFNLLTYKGGTYNNIYTDRPDMKYYNPLSCKH